MRADVSGEVFEPIQGGNEIVKPTELKITATINFVEQSRNSIIITRNRNWIERAVLAEPSLVQMLQTVKGKLEVIIKEGKKALVDAEERIQAHRILLKKAEQPRCVDCGGPRSVGSSERCRTCYTGFALKPKRMRAVEIAIDRATIKTPRTYRCRWCDWEKKRLGRCENCGRANNTWSAKRAAELEMAS